MKGSIPTIQMVIKVFEKANRPLTIDDVVRLIRDDFDVRTTNATIRNSVINLSVNVQARTAWHKRPRLSTDGHRYDRLFFDENRKYYMLYDRKIHGIWGIQDSVNGPQLYRVSNPAETNSLNQTKEETVAPETVVAPISPVIKPAPVPVEKVSGQSGFARLESDIRACKLNPGCPDRSVRQYYYENEETAQRHPVMFVCHCPATRTGARDGRVREQCWQATDEDFHFNEMRRMIGMENAYITNSVKCGTTVQSPDTSTECEKCAGFLAREIDLVNPRIIVAVGGKADEILRTYTKPHRIIMTVPHYSWRRRPNYDADRERKAYSAIKTALTSQAK